MDRPCCMLDLEWLELHVCMITREFPPCMYANLCWLKLTAVVELALMIGNVVDGLTEAKAKPKIEIIDH